MYTISYEMEKERAKKILNVLIESSVQLQKTPRDSPQFPKWKRDTTIAITNIFGDSGHIQDFAQISFGTPNTGLAILDSYHQEAYIKGLKCSAAILQSMINEIDQYWPISTPKTKKTTNTRPSPTYSSNAKERTYYSIRTGKHPSGSRLNLAIMSKLFVSLWEDLKDKGYFQEAFGYNCIDIGYVQGKLGDVSIYFLRTLHKDNLWPIPTKYLFYNESDLFDVIELLYDHVSSPVSGTYHSYDDCGWHYETFDKAAGQAEYVSRVNELLKDYTEGYELSPDGEILHKAIPGAETLLNDEPPKYDKNNVDNRIREAIHRYKQSRSSLTEKHNSIKMLADILEFLRPKIKIVLTTADEKDLFNIANNFGIRHHKQGQKTDYDKDIWFDWIFYYYLATVNTAIRLIKKHESGT